MRRGQGKLSLKRHNSVGIPVAVLFRQRRGHHHSRAYCVVRSLNSAGAITLCFVLIIPVARPLGMLFARRRKALRVIRGLPAVVNVHEGVHGPSRPSRLMALSSVLSAVTAIPVFQRSVYGTAGLHRVLSRPHPPSASARPYGWRKTAWLGATFQRCCPPHTTLPDPSPPPT